MIEKHSLTFEIDLGRISSDQLKALKPIAKALEKSKTRTFPMPKSGVSIYKVHFTYPNKMHSTVITKRVAKERKILLKVLKRTGIKPKVVNINLNTEIINYDISEKS